MLHRAAIYSVTCILVLAIALVAFYMADRLGYLNDEKKAGSQYGSIVNSDDESRPYQELTYDVTPPDERKWIQRVAEDIRFIEIEDSVFFELTDVDVREGEYFVSDLAGQKIFRYSNGRLINQIGEGKGEGPGEFGHFLDFVVSDRGVHVADINARKIVNFSHIGTPLNEFRMDRMPNRIAYFDDSLAVFSISRGEIIKISFSGDHGTAFGQIIADQGSPVDIDGYLAACDDHWIVYAAMYSSTLLVFDDRGMLVRSIQTMDRLPFPRTAIVGGMARAPRQSRMVLDVAIDDHKMYISTRVNEDGNYTLIDRYGLPTGTYIDSARLPFPVDRMDVENEIVYAIQQDARLIAFRY